MPMPRQKLPTNAKPTSKSFNAPIKPLIDVLSRRRAGFKSDRENIIREGKCRGSKEELMEDDEEALR